MAPAAYSLGATPPLTRHDKRHPFSRSTTASSASRPPPSAFGLDSTNSLPDPPSSPTTTLAGSSTGSSKPGFFRRLAEATSRAKRGDDRADGRIPWETSSSPAAFAGAGAGARSEPGSPTARRAIRGKRSGERSLRRRASEEEQDDEREDHFSVTRTSPSPTTTRFDHPRDRDAGRTHARGPSTASSDGYSLLFASGIHNIKKETLSAPPSTGSDLDYDDEPGAAGLSPTKRLRGIVKKSSKFSLRSLVHPSGGGSSSPPPPDSPELVPQPSLGYGSQPAPSPLPSPRRRPSLSSFSGLRSPTRQAFPTSPGAALDISSPVAPRAPPLRAGGAFLTPLPSPLPTYLGADARERKGSAASAIAAWALGGEEGMGKGSVRGKAARLLGEEVVPSGKAARLLGMERKKTLVKKPSAMSLQADSIASLDRRPSNATSHSGGAASYDSPPSSIPPTPGYTPAPPPLSARELRRRSVSDPNLLASAKVHRAPAPLARTPSPPPAHRHRNLYEEDDDLWDDSAAEASPALSTGLPLFHPSSPEPDAALSSRSPPPTSDYAGSSPRPSSGRASSTFSLSLNTTLSMSPRSPPTSSPPHGPGHERVLSYASSSYGIPSTFYPFTPLSPSLSSPPPLQSGHSPRFSSSTLSSGLTSPVQTPSPHHPHLQLHRGSASSAATSAPFTTYRATRRLSPDSIRFSALGLAMRPESFVASSASTSSTPSPGSASPVPSKRPPMGSRTASASSVATSRRSVSGPPTPSRTPPTSPAARTARSDTLFSVASAHTRTNRRGEALEALEGRGAGGAGGGQGEGRKALLARSGLVPLREREDSERRRAVRESRPFLDFEASSEDDEAPMRASSGAGAGREASILSLDSSSSSSGGATSVAPSPSPVWPPPSASLPAPPASAPAFRPSTPPRPTPIPVPSLRHHTRDPSTSSFLSSSSSAPSEGGMSDYSTFSSTAAAFPQPPSAATAGAPFSLLGAVMPPTSFSPPAPGPRAEYRFPPTPETSPDQPKRSGTGAGMGKALPPRTSSRGATGVLASASPVASRVAGAGAPGGTGGGHRKTESRESFLRM
ncbi:hypothetical protein JCM10207_008632 [Rhodosporidiobolus poonsookiae]